MEARCKNCKFWGSQSPGYAGTPWEGLRECKATREIWEVEGSEIEKALAVVSDASSYAATLLCRGDFGCVQFEPKL
jgi:hypothetical protein